MKLCFVPCLTFLWLTGIGLAVAEVPLNIGDYLRLGTSAQIYPSVEQLQMLRPLVPEARFQPAPSISDRDYWGQVAASPSGRAWLQQAQADFDQPPEVPISDEIYREANLKGSRSMYKPRYYRTMERLEKFMLAECMENTGRYLPRIELYLRAIMDMKSWLHPNHDDRENSDLEGRRVSIDLGARKFGSDLALAEVLLGDKLPDALRGELSAQVKRRIIDSYFKSCRGEVENNKWIRSSNNWNSVCTSGSVFVAITMAETAEERAIAVGCALNSMRAYLDGFGDDGYCSEGVGYWRYGFGHYLYLAQILSDYTGGRIDLFAFDDPEKIRRIAAYPQNAEIQHGFYPTFSDTSVRSSGDEASFAGLMTAQRYGMPYRFDAVQEDAVEQLIVWAMVELPVQTGEAKLPPSSLFEDVGMVVSRGGQDVPFSVAFKAGHNAENHNHSDVGSYTLILGDKWVAGDLGGLSYVAGAFDSDNPGRSSWGHPVPRVDGQLQSNGRSFRGRIMEHTFTAASDRVVMDLKPAYEVPALATLIRTLENDRAGDGAVTVRDQFSAATPIRFGTAITTLAKYRIADDQTILLQLGDREVRVAVTSSGEGVKITAEPVPVRISGGAATRIGLDLVESSSQGFIELHYLPSVPPQN